MHDQSVNACRDDGARQGEHGLARLLLVDADTAFDRHWEIDGLFHRADAFGDQPRFAHQAGAECAVLHAIRWAADIEIDFVVAENSAQIRAARASSAGSEPPS